MTGRPLENRCHGRLDWTLDFEIWSGKRKQHQHNVNNVSEGEIAYILIGPRGGGALCGHAHAGAFLAAAPVVALEVIESQFAAVAVLPLDVLLRRKRDTEFMSALRQEAKRQGAMLLQC